MSQEMDEKRDNPGKQAEELLGQLERTYTEYYEKSQQQEQKKDIATILFGKWFSSASGAYTDIVHQNFISETERIVTELAVALKELEKEDPGLCNTIAFKAAGCMIRPEKMRNKTDADWYIIAAENMCLPIVPFLSREGLEHYRDFMLSRAPRRMMFPKQKELLGKIEELLK